MKTSGIPTLSTSVLLLIAPKSDTGNALDVDSFLKHLITKSKETRVSGRKSLRIASFTLHLKFRPRSLTDRAQASEA